MPLRAIPESYDRPEMRFDPILINAGEAAIWMDISVSLGHFVLAVCSKFDMGGAIYIAAETEKAGTGLSVVSYDDNNPHDVILPGLYGGIDIVDQDDEHMRLNFQHEFPGGRISSYN